uniref:Saposin B-type domain-containing protein n=1 Tax=Acrobeloides nanus TaxID=290746 RepID=A0A914E3G2_9BILA
MKNKFVLFFILLLVNFDIFSGKFKKVAKEKFNPLPVSSIIDDQPSDVVDGPALTLGCTMCQQIMNLTVSHYPNLATSIRRTILTEHCASLGLFSNICTKALNQYFTQIYNELKAELNETNKMTSKLSNLNIVLGY